MPVSLAHHRLTALERVDRRLVLNNGTIEAEGTPADLLRSSPTYRDLFRRSS